MVVWKILIKQQKKKPETKLVSKVELRAESDQFVWCQEDLFFTVTDRVTLCLGQPSSGPGQPLLPPTPRMSSVTYLPGLQTSSSSLISPPSPLLSPLSLPESLPPPLHHHHGDQSHPGQQLVVVLVETLGPGSGPGNSSATRWL